MGEEKPKLPIEGGIEDKSSLRKKLNESLLSEDCLKEIARLFGVNQKDFGSIDCCEYHGHTFKCINFYRDETMIVDRLLEELRKYQQAIKNSQKSIDESLGGYSFKG